MGDFGRGQVRRSERHGSIRPRAVLRDWAVEAFDRYARIDTTSVFGSHQVPSSEGQRTLASVVAGDLRAAGVLDVEVTTDGFLYATIEGDAPGVTIGLIAHLDTTPAASGTNVRPRIHRAWNGRPIILSNDVVLDPQTRPELVDHIGHDLITSDGTTLLGADDKAGIAAIVAAARYWQEKGSFGRARVRIALTPDEEVGRGGELLDLTRLGADLAYTVDGQAAAEIQDETFAAAHVEVTVEGAATHPGYAFGRMVNTNRVIAQLIERSTVIAGAPETTRDREGYIHVISSEATVGQGRAIFALRDFDVRVLNRRITRFRKLIQTVSEETNAEATVVVKPAYSNMKSVLARVPSVVGAASEAIRRSGMVPIRTAVRGGTDGARLTQRGLPTPNLFTGAMSIHTPAEWICTDDLGAAAETVTRLPEVWSEPAFVKAFLRERSD